MSLGLIKEYNNDWVKSFNYLKEIFSKELNGLFISIEHVGSTSIPGMNAKPIIDIDVVIKEENFELVKSKLERLGYFYQGDLGLKGREAFDLRNKEKAKELPIHYLYVCYENSFELKKHIVFRDYLRNNNKALNRLKTLKSELEETCKTWQEYINKKSDLVQELTDEAFNYFQ